MIKILFQGDSITDMGRNRENIHDLGNGYPKFVSQMLMKKFPMKEFEFTDLAISADTSAQLLARFENDFTQADPDIISILIGINDTWRKFNGAGPTSPEQFEENYRKMLTFVKEKSNAKIVLLEAFLVEVPDKLEFRDDLNPKIGVTRRLAREFAEAYIPLDGLFAAASVKKPATYWTADGVHPTDYGAELIAKHYVEAVSEIL